MRLRRRDKRDREDFVLADLTIREAIRVCMVSRKLLTDSLVEQHHEHLREERRREKLAREERRRLKREAEEAAYQARQQAHRDARAAWERDNPRLPCPDCGHPMGYWHGGRWVCWNDCVSYMRVFAADGLTRL